MVQTNQATEDLHKIATAKGCHSQTTIVDMMDQGRRVAGRGGGWRKIQLVYIVPASHARETLCGDFINSYLMHTIELYSNHS